MNKNNQKNESAMQKKADKFFNNYIDKHWKEMITHAINSGHSLI